MNHFLSEIWIRKKIAEYGEAVSPHQIAALMHIYVGSLTLKEVSEIAGLSLKDLEELRTKASFMRLVDNFKKEYSYEFREALLINDYSIEEYETLAADYSMLDEMLQIQIKVPLFTRLRDLSQSLNSKKAYGLKIETYDLRVFTRLFTFFMFMEKYGQTLTTRGLSDIKQVAEKVLSVKMDDEVNRTLSDPVSMRSKRLKELKARLENLTSK